MVQHQLRIRVGGVLRTNIDVREALLIPRLAAECLPEDALQQRGKGVRELPLPFRRPEMVDDVVPLVGDLDLEGVHLPDIPYELEGVIGHVVR